jgi:hypothetical protein
MRAWCRKAKRRRIGGDGSAQTACTLAKHPEVLARLAAELEKQIQAALDDRKRTGEGVRGIAKRFGVDPSTVQRISRPFAVAAA